MKLTTSPRIGPATLTLLASTFLVAAYNTAFWRNFLIATGNFSLGHVPLIAGSFVVIVMLFNAFLTLASFRYVLKPVLIALFLATACATYFMNQYGTQFDRSMIQNLFETDIAEATELLSWKLLLTVTMLGIMPSLLVWRVRLEFPTGVRGMLRRAGFFAGSLVIAVVMLLAFSKTLVPSLREHRELRFLLTPTNYIQALNSYVKFKRAKAVVVAPLGTDAVKLERGSGNHARSVTLIVVGETARAANFSLNGYARITNPELARQSELINFPHMQSCGTATAVSLPCMFSNLGRENYTDAQAYAQQGLLDVLQHAGYQVLWRDNNSGCKGACDRVAYEDLAKPVAGNQWCVADECYDERLLERLPEMIRAAKDDLVIVLHQKGSHGPAYYKRYPAQFKRFAPVCETIEMDKCSNEAIVAAYDNTILYTDHFLNRTIELLKASAASDHVNTAMLYFSDHGESLGEHNMYLHGAPYLFAPAEQREVPFLMWLSDGFKSRYRIDQPCLAGRVGQTFSHDNIFHSVLGMLSVKTSVYQPGLDLFAPCIK
ncbi:MAG: phosphoethanolamine--lipid A transferase [Pseudomonadota bacterium]